MNTNQKLQLICCILLIIASFLCTKAAINFQYHLLIAHHLTRRNANGNQQGERRKRKAPKEWMCLQSRKESWYENVLLKSGDQKWIENLRLPQHTVDRLCEELTELAPSEITVRTPINLKKRICIALYKLATCAEYRVVAEAFGVSKTTIHRCLYRFCKAMVQRREMYISWYTLEEAKELAHKNRVNYGYPQAIGAIDGTHIPITPPADGYADFICRKQYPSIVLQAVVDPNYKFRDTYCNTPGSAHDASVYRRSPLSRTLMEKMPQDDVIFDGVPVPLHLLGDPAYPISPLIIKGFIGRNLSAQEESYNVYHSSARMCVEIGFGRLKSRWRILCKRLDVDYTFAPMIVTTCCMLHNLCENLKTCVPPAINEQFPQPPMPRDMTVDREALTIRTAVMNHLGQNYPLRKSFHK